MDENLLYASTAIVTSLVTLLGVWLKHHLTCKDHCTIMKKEMKQNANVYTALQYTLAETGADRAYVFEFHNGDHYFSGRGQQKFSCTYEVVGKGISSEASDSQNYRVSNFHHYIHSLIHDGSFCQPNLEKSEDYAFYKLLEKKGVKSLYNVPLKTLNGKIIGFLGLDFVREERDDPELKNALRKQARVIAGYIV